MNAEIKGINRLEQLPTTNNITNDIRNILAEARKIVVRTTNSAMVVAYWMIGKRIVVEEQNNSERAKYGEYILQSLSQNLAKEFGNGFSYANLCNMRQFYKTYSDEILYTLRRELSWSHNRLIMRVADDKTREWYLKEAHQAGWSVRELERNIKSFYYQRQLEKGQDLLHACANLRI